MTIAVGWPQILSSLKSTLETDAPLDLDPLPGADADERVDVDAEIHRDLARASNGRCWALLGTEARTEREDRELVEAAYTSAWHWRHAGTPLNEQRAEWMIAHVHAVLGDSAAALRHAQRCRAITITEQLDGFDLAYSHEALARAHAAAGDHGAAEPELAAAWQVAATVADAEDREILEGDLRAAPWFGVAVPA